MIGLRRLRFKREDVQLVVGIGQVLVGAGIIVAGEVTAQGSFLPTEQLAILMSSGAAWGGIGAISRIKREGQRLTERLQPPFMGVQTSGFMQTTQTNDQEMAPPNTARDWEALDPPSVKETHAQGEWSD